MIVKFLRHCKLRVGRMEYCGDGCCSHMEYDEVDFVNGDVSAAEVDAYSWLGENVADISYLTYKEDYEIVEFP